MLAPNSSSDPATVPVLQQRDGDVAILTLHRPAQRNALSNAMIASLYEAFQSLDGDPDIKAIILCAEGPAFCAGHDLNEMTAERQSEDQGRAAFADLFDRCGQLMAGIQRLSKPVIAAVQGPAAAAGCQLVAACDLAVAVDEAFFATPGVNIGLFCSTPMVALSRNVSRKHAMEMLLLGESVPAARAAELGLVNRVVRAANLRAEAMAMARTIASKSTTAVRYGKRAFYEQVEMDLTSAYAHTARVMTENMLAGDACEGIGAFLEKRSPDWPDG